MVHMGTFQWLVVLLDITAKRPTYFIIYYALLFLSSLPYFLFCLYLAEVTLCSFCSTLFFSSFFLYWIDHFDLVTSLVHCPFSFPHYSFFIPTFQVITHNSHPQLMALPWVEVHITQCWVRAKTSSVSALATLNLCFWQKLRCTCPRRDQGQHIIPREIKLVKKMKVYNKLKLFG